MKPSIEQLGDWWIAHAGTALTCSDLQRDARAQLGDQNLVVCGEESNPRLIVSHNGIMWLIRDANAQRLKIDDWFANRPGVESKTLGQWVSIRVASSKPLPVVLLVNLFRPEAYPIPRFTLGISSLAAVLRSRLPVEVIMFDFQLKDRRASFNETIRNRSCDIVGFSVNFGQLDEFRECLGRVEKYAPSSMQIVGNSVPALACEQFLNEFSGVVVCRKAGEAAMTRILERYWINLPMVAVDVPGITFEIRGARFRSTEANLFNFAHAPPPALDDATAVLEQGGVLTAELSRGCQFNQCSFCPRGHKGQRWTSLHLPKVTSLMGNYIRLIEHAEAEPTVYLADEEFLGPDPVSRVADLNVAIGGKIRFDASCRLDQIYAPGHSTDWYRQRIKCFENARSCGLGQLFVGLESGSNSQLDRYSKGYDARSAMTALRLLSALGINLRFGFILFDPMMSWDDLQENVAFLGRSDVILKAGSLGDVEKMTDWVVGTSSLEMSMLQHGNGYVYEHVSYMISGLEVLSSSNYMRELQRNFPHLLTGDFDLNFARYGTAYLFPEIELLKQCCDAWINNTFTIAYAIKGLRNRATGPAKVILSNVQRGFRRISFQLLQTLMSYGSGCNAEANSLFKLALRPALAELDMELSNTVRQLQAENFYWLPEFVRTIEAWRRDDLRNEPRKF